MTISLEGPIASDRIRARAKAWANAEIKSAIATLDMSRIPKSNVWQAELERGARSDGIYTLTVTVTDQNGQTEEDSIRLVLVRSATRTTPSVLGRSAGHWGPNWGPTKTGENGKCSLMSCCPQSWRSALF